MMEPIKKPLNTKKKLDAQNAQMSKSGDIGRYFGMLQAMSHQYKQNRDGSENIQAVNPVCWLMCNAISCAGVHGRHGRPD